MEDHDSDQFSWPGLFIVTACCSFLFNVAVRVLDGYFSNLLSIIAVIAAILGVLSLGIQWLLRWYDKKRDSRLIS